MHPINRSIILSLSLALSLSAQSSIPASNMEARSFSDSQSGLTLPYRFLPPPGYNAQNEYPVVVFLHGMGERGSDNSSQIDGQPAWANAFVTAQARYAHPAFLAAPQCPLTHVWTDLTGVIINLIHSFMEEYNVDSSRIYITGLSMGGYGTFGLIQETPDFFAAAAPVCGAGDPSKAGLIKDIPFWAFHGDADPTVPVERSREMVRGMREAGGAPLYTEYPGVDHFSWIPAYAEPELLSWMFAQDREGGSPPAPVIGLTALSADGETIDLDWSLEQGSLDGIMYFNVYKNGQRLTLSPSDLAGADSSGLRSFLKALHFADSDFNPDTDTLYSVSAVNYRGEESPMASVSLSGTGLARLLKNTIPEKAPPRWFLITGKQAAVLPEKTGMGQVLLSSGSIRILVR